MRARKDFAAIAFDCSRQSRQILQRVKLSLPWKMQTRPGIERLQRSPLELANVNQTSTMRRRQFVVEHFHSSARWNEKIAIHSLEFAINLFTAHDLFDPIDCSGVTLRGQTRTILTKQPLKLIEPIIQGVAQMRRGARSHAAANWSVVEYHDDFAFPRQ